MQLSNITYPLSLTKAPLYTWPSRLKQTIFYSAVFLCVLAYLALIGGAVTIGVALLSWLLG